MFPSRDNPLGSGVLCRLAQRTTTHTLMVSVVTVMLTACGGGSNTSSKVERDSLEGAAQGYLFIEERSGKRVIDAWFSQGASSSPSGTLIWSDAWQACNQLTDTREVTSLDSQSVGTRWQDTLFAGGSLTLTSRSETVVSLLPHRYNDAVLYASDERWLDTPLPDDTYLSISGSDEFPAVDAIAVLPLESLVQIRPSGGALMETSAAIEWQPSVVDDDEIQMTLAQGDASRADENTVVRCRIQDHGTFQLPVEVQQVFEPESQIMVYLSRVRYTEHQQSNVSVHVTQLSFP